MTHKLAQQASQAAAKRVLLGKRSWPYTVLVPHKDRKDEIYYRPTRGGLHQTKEVTKSELFLLPDLVLDLDDECNKNVRSLTKEDEEEMAKRWNVGPSREKARSEVSELKKNIEWSRYQLQRLNTAPTSAWPITSHDMFSVALRGAPSAASDSSVNNTSDDNIGREATQEYMIPDTEEEPTGVIQQSTPYLSISKALDPRKKPDLISVAVSEKDRKSVV